MLRNEADGLAEGLKGVRRPADADEEAAKLEVGIGAVRRLFDGTPIVRFRFTGPAGLLMLVSEREGRLDARHSRYHACSGRYGSAGSARLRNLAPSPIIRPASHRSTQVDRT